jgi:hypothetical protein
MAVMPHTMNADAPIAITSAIPFAAPDSGFDMPEELG